ncbi:MAG: protein BatD [Candidatus Eisenbacteria bacterium]|uniref:Protein BatD n=1 Tax=Eiseniibacteriota bacterium TaxID=2212470 RepID=A0A538TYT9_UNCEI|nr:MAG: protein BatD [Candidatus Eisenbacteria bacterium]
MDAARGNRADGGGASRSQPHRARRNRHSAGGGARRCGRQGAGVRRARRALHRRQHPSAELRLGQRARVGGERVPLELDVGGAAPTITSGGGGAGAPATLVVDVQPRDPSLGQEMTLVVRLVQRTNFAEDPQYTPPTTTGFWTDKPTTPQSFYAVERGERVLVTETRLRIYPLAVGEATIGEASALVVVAQDGFGLSGGLFGDRREMVLRSAPVRVRVRPLPPGAPAGFTGAAGKFDAVWSADRSHTSRDVPITLRLDLRGRGNLPLVRPPSFGEPDLEALASTTEDSLPSPEQNFGRKRFQWTVMPQKEGRLEIAAPAFAWFDPASGGYVQSRPRPIVVEVGPAVFAGPGEEAGFPRAFSDHPVDPGARRAQPWAFAFAGLALGAAWRLWRAGPRTTLAGEVGASAWLARLRGVTGPGVWRVMEDASAWLETQPATVSDPGWRAVRDRIAAARYGGSVEKPESVRKELMARIARVAPRARTRVPRRALAVLLALAGIAAAVACAPRPGPGRAAEQCAAADQAARRGEVDRARRVWLELWRSQGGQAGLAARLAWAHVQAGEIGPAALWVLRGEMMGPRDPALRWVEERVREAGGLVGATAPRWPLRPIEWSALALVVGIGAGLCWPRRVRAVAVATLALVCALVYPVQGWMAERSGRAVMLAMAPLQGSDVELEPGQLVTIRAREGGRVRVAAGRVIDGWVPASIVAPVAGAADG